MHLEAVPSERIDHHDDDILETGLIKDLNVKNPRIAIALLVLLELWMVGCGPRPPLEDKNIIIMVIDTLRRDRLEVHGYDKGITPVMDGLAREGICFQRAYAPSCWTKPTVASIFSGLYPGRHEVVGDLAIHQNLAFFEPDFITLAEQLKKAGYRTGAFITNANLISLYHFDQGFDHFVQPAGHAEEITDQALEWIRQESAKGKFFIYLHLIDPHSPYFPPEMYRERFIAGKTPGKKSPFTRLGRFEEVSLWMDQFKEWTPSLAGEAFQYDFQEDELAKTLAGMDTQLTPKKLRSQIHLDFKGRDDPDLLSRIDYLTALYDGEVAYSDTQAGRFLDEIRSMGLLDKSMLVVTSDHGEAFLEHVTWGHRNYVHGEEIDIPLIFLIPGADGAPLKGRPEEPVSLVDLYPTVLEMTGLDIPSNQEGLSLWPLITGGTSATFRNRPIFNESYLSTGKYVSVIAMGKKMIHARPIEGEEEWKFYDLEKDPGELKPMSVEEGGDAAKALKRSIEGFIKSRTINFNKKGEMGIPSKEEIKQLRDLGYI